MWSKAEHGFGRSRVGHENGFASPRNTRFFSMPPCRGGLHVVTTGEAGLGGLSASLLIVGG